MTISIFGRTPAVRDSSVVRYRTRPYGTSGRVTAPLSVGDAAIRLAVIHKLGWIKRQKKQFAAQPRQSSREMVSGETHYFQGRAYRLRVVEVLTDKNVTVIVLKQC